MQGMRFPYWHCKTSKRDSRHVTPKTEHLDLSWSTDVKRGGVEMGLDSDSDEGGGKPRLGPSK